MQDHTQKDGPDHTAHQASAAGTVSAPMRHGAGGGHYGRFGWMLLLSFAAMYVLMYAMVNRLGNAVPNINTAYMAGLMTAPMAILEILLMGRMYPDKRKNMLIVLAGVALLLACWFAIRLQAGVSDHQFLKSMIPHHAGAILMCDQATLTDPEVKALCTGIVKAQEVEIAQMKALLER